MNTGIPDVDVAVDEYDAALEVEPEEGLSWA